MSGALYILYRDGCFYSSFFTRDAAVASYNICLRHFPDSDWKLLVYT